jgi:ribonuclease VapC
VIVDSSAIVAVVLREPAYERIGTLIIESVSGVGAPTLAETGIVLADRAPRAELSSFLRRSGLIVMDFSDDHWLEAVAAYRRFGKGHHPAKLNLGDCLTYAVAKLADEPLLTLDEGFQRTDLQLVL